MREAIPLTASGWTVAVLGGRRLRRRVAARLGRADGASPPAASSCWPSPCRSSSAASPSTSSARSSRSGSRSATGRRRDAGRRTPRRTPIVVAHDRGAGRRRARCASTSRRSARAAPPRPCTAADRTGAASSQVGPALDREDRPARPDAPGDRPDRRATDAVGAPARRRPRPAPVGFAKDLEGPTSRRLTGRRRRVPRAARVRARRRPPPHPLDVVGAHRAR